MYKSSLEMTCTFLPMSMSVMNLAVCQDRSIREEPVLVQELRLRSWYSSLPLHLAFPLYSKPEKTREYREALPSLNIDLVRKEIPVTSRRAYFDNAGTGPPSINVLNAIHEYLTDWRDYGENWEEWLPIIIESRRLFGKMIGAGLDEIARVPNGRSALH